MHDSWKWLWKWREREEGSVSICKCMHFNSCIIYQIATKSKCVNFRRFPISLSIASLNAERVCDWLCKIGIAHRQEPNESNDKTTIDGKIELLTIYGICLKMVRLLGSGFASFPIANSRFTSISMTWNKANGKRQTLITIEVMAWPNSMIANAFQV